MPILTIKLWRNIMKTKGQFLSLVAVVMVGISIYIGMSTTYVNLQRSRDNFYRDCRFADYYFHVIRAPEQVTRQIAAIPGVALVTGRIQRDVPIIKAHSQRATGRLVSYPLPVKDQVNQIHLTSGRMFEKYPQGGGVEVLVDPGFAKANHLDFGSIITIVAEGKEVALTVVGTATSPEFIYPIKNAADMTPDPETFGIIMIPNNQAQQIFNLSGQVNQVVMTLAPGASEDDIKEKVKTILGPYGNLADYPRSQQLSDAILKGELDQLETQAVIMPAIFLIIAAAIQFIMIGRMLKAHRLQIGIMKAIGYSNSQIIWHYTAYALMISLVGAVLGTLLGLVFASTFSGMYAQYFNLPQAIGSVSATSIYKGFLLSLGVGLAAGLLASRRVVAINPAESMRPEAPVTGRRILLEGWNWLWQRLNPAWKMSMRTIGRNRSRFTVTLVGVMLAIGMLVVSLFFRDSVDYLLNRAFFQDQTYDFLVRFEQPVKQSELLNISRIDGVTRIEPLFELPVRLHYQGKTEDNVIEGFPGNVTLRWLVDEKDRPLRLPANGIIINDKIAEKLGVKVGDEVKVETLLGVGPTRWATLRVFGLNHQMVGQSSYVTLENANRLLLERHLVTGAMLKIDPGLSKAVEKQLNDMTGVASVLSQQKALENFNKNLDAMLYTISVMVTFAVILGFAIVYNSTVISLTERHRELALLRVMGMTRQEVSILLFNETLVQAVLGIILGLPLGYLMANGLAKAVSTDLFSFQAVIYPMTYVYSAIGGCVFIIIAHLFAQRGVKRLDLVEVLKDRD